MEALFHDGDLYDLFWRSLSTIRLMIKSSHGLHILLNYCFIVADFCMQNSSLPGTPGKR
jgi:hypothetical protein